MIKDGETHKNGASQYLRIASLHAKNKIWYLLKQLC